MVTPVNEMSYLAWAGGHVRCLFPFCAARGVELKAQLVRATIEAIEAIREVSPGARFLQPEPLMTLVPAPEHPLTWRRVESDNLLQYQAWDMLSGRVWPSLGGHPRYQRPMIVSETGAEGRARRPPGARIVDGRADPAGAAAAGSARRDAARRRGPRAHRRLKCSPSPLRPTALGRADRRVRAAVLVTDPLQVAITAGEALRSLRAGVFSVAFASFVGAGSSFTRPTSNLNAS